MKLIGYVHGVFTQHVLQSVTTVLHLHVLFPTHAGEDATRACASVTKNMNYGKNSIDSGSNSDVPGDDTEPRKKQALQRVRQGQVVRLPPKRRVYVSYIYRPDCAQEELHTYITFRHISPPQYVVLIVPGAHEEMERLTIGFCIVLMYKLFL